MTTRPASIALASVLTALALGPLAAAAHAGGRGARADVHALHGPVQVEGPLAAGGRRRRVEVDIRRFRALPQPRAGLHLPLPAAAEGRDLPAARPRPVPMAA